MKDYRLLLHWHPQGSYLARCIFHAFKYARKAERIHIGLIVGSNFMAGTNTSSIEFIEQLVRETHTNSIISFELIRLKTSLWNFSLFCSSDTPKTKALDHHKYNVLFLSSIRDSLCRGLEPCYNNEDYMINRQSNLYIEEKRIDYANHLINNYKEIIHAFSPDITAISHGTYDHYISLYIASDTRGIPVMVVNGGCNMAYICRTGLGSITDPCVANAFSEIVYMYTREKNILKNIIPSALRGLISESYNRYLPNSSAGIIASSSIYQNKSGRTNPIIFLPVFAEMNQHNCLKQVAFETRYEWLKWCFMISFNDKRMLHLYTHPQTSAYGQNQLTKNLIKEAHESYPADFCLINELDTLGQISTSENLVPMTMSSSLSLELNMLGKLSCASNYSTSTPLGYNIEYDKTNSYEEIEASFNERKCMKIEENICDAANTALKFNDYNKNRSQDFYIRKAFEKLIWFGNFTNNGPYEFITLLETYIKSLDVIEIETKNFIQLMPY